MPSKINNQLINLIFAIVFSSICISCQDKISSLTKLRTDLLTNYDRHNRPVKQYSTTVNVTFRFSLIQIIEVNIKAQTFRIDGYTRLLWKDEYLTWDPAKYSGIKTLMFRPDEIWTPEILLLETAIGANPLTNLKLMVRSNGAVVQILSADLVVTSLLDLTNYPFDSQTCLLQFGAYFYSANELSIQKQGSYLISGPAYQSPEWIVNKLDGGVFTQTGYTNYSTGYVTIKVTRRSDVHLYYILIPYLTASVLGLVVFLLPIGSYYRMVFAGLALFILIFLLVFLADNLGFHSLGVPYAVRCISIFLLLIGLSLVVTTLAHQLIMNAMATSPPLPSFLAHHLANPFLVKIFFLSGDGIDESKFFDQESNLDEQFTANQQFQSTSRAAVREWVKLLRLIDRLLFIIYIISLIFYHS